MNSLTKTLLVVINLVPLFSCVVINQGFPIERRALTVNAARIGQSEFHSLRPVSIDGKIMDMIIVNSVQNWRLNLHFNPSRSMNDDLVLTSTLHNYDDSNDVELDFRIPQYIFEYLYGRDAGEYLTLKFDTSKSMELRSIGRYFPAILDDIDSNYNAAKVRMYSGRANFGVDNEVYFSAVTDPFPLLIIGAIVVFCAYEYGNFKGECKYFPDAQPKRCPDSLRPVYENSLFGCKFKRCEVRE